MVEVGACLVSSIFCLGSSPNFFFDGSDEENEGTRVFTTGETTTPYLDFGGEPDGGTAQNCLGSWTSAGTHNDIDCDTELSPVDVICEFESKCRLQEKKLTSGLLRAVLISDYICTIP